MYLGLILIKCSIHDAAIILLMYSVIQYDPGLSQKRIP